MGVRFSPGLQIRWNGDVDMLKFLRESREELKKVVWPPRDEVLNMTIVVLAAVFLISAVLFGIDRSFEAIFDGILRMAGGSRPS